MFTQEYYKHVQINNEFHKGNKTFSGKNTLRHLPEIKDLISKLNCKTMLDYGCGKAYLYTEEGSAHLKLPLDKYLGVETYKFDPCVTEYSQRPPQNNYDLVICVNVLGLVPKSDTINVINDLYRFADKGLYVTLFTKSLATKKPSSALICFSMGVRIKSY